VFQADADGAVDLAAQAPGEGTYHEADAMGLVWSMELDPAADDECYFRKRTLDPLQVHFTAEVGGQPVARASAERRFLAPGTVRSELREGDLTGVYFRPPGPEPRPGVIVLGGGDGGLLEHGAALLASRGFAALALGYFGLESLPQQPHEIPLEYFGRAITWLQARPEVDARRMALSGTSLGGMYALLAASVYPQVKAVVCYVPLGIVMAQGPENAAPCTYQGRVLPFLSIVPNRDEIRRIEEKQKAREPASIAPVLLRLLADEALTAPAEIPVGRINGPVLLVTGADDQAIPSPLFAERIVARLAAHDFPYSCRHLSYAGAGHAIGLPHCHGLPYVPTYGRPPAGGPLFAFGGNTRDDARANADSWVQVTRFLKESLLP
jgi:dienelactone hydrolase